MSTFSRVEGKAQARGWKLTIERGGTAAGAATCAVARPEQWESVQEFRLCAEGLEVLVIGFAYAAEGRTLRDNELITHLAASYADGGIHSVRRAIGGGIYALVMSDQNTRRLYVTVDPLACMPVYYRQDEGCVRIGTSEFDLEPGSLNHAACAEYLRYGHLMFAPALHADVHRLGPGQILEVDLATGRLIPPGYEVYPAYPRPKDRIRDLDEACTRLDKALKHFFERVQDERMSIGLSSGYDSRLISAYLAHVDPRLVTFGVPGADESELAQRIAAALGRRTSTFCVSSGSPSRLVDDFRYGMQTMDSLECSHVFALLEALMEGQSDFLVDGLLGDTALGSGFCYKLHTSSNPVWKTILGFDRYDQPLDPAFDWVAHMCRHHPRRVPDSEMGNLGALADECARTISDEVNDAIRRSCQTYHDGVDMINYRARTSRVFACGPVTFLRRCKVLLPFYDSRVFDTCMSIDTSLRAGDRLYNALWRYRFPELADIPRESTGGRATQSDRMYRATHCMTSMRRRVTTRFGGLFGKTSRAGGDLDQLHAMYCADVRNQAFFQRVREATHDQMTSIGASQFLDEVPGHGDDTRLYLRAISLATLLAPAEVLR